MRTIELENIYDVEIILVSLYGQPVKGWESLRLFDKILSELERVATINYDENGNILVYEMENGAVKMGEDGKPIRILKFKDDPKRCIFLEEAHCSFLRARISSLEWQGASIRSVLKLLSKLQPDNQDSGTSVSPECAMPSST